MATITPQEDMRFQQLKQMGGLWRRYTLKWTFKLKAGREGAIADCACPAMFFTGSRLALIGYERSLVTSAATSAHRHARG